MTRRMRVREARNEDAAAIGRIAAANGMPGWQWPDGCWGVVAILDDELVAFAAVREIRGGFLVEDLWAKPHTDGLRGLGALADAIESKVAEVAKARGVESLPLGGFVINHNLRHMAALEKRGYEHFARVLKKEVKAA